LRVGFLIGKKSSNVQRERLTDGVVTQDNALHISSLPLRQFPGTFFLCPSHPKCKSGNKLLICYGLSPEKHNPLLFRHGICAIMVKSRSVQELIWYRKSGLRTDFAFSLAQRTEECCGNYHYT
jgi:hypothetical protein